MGYVSVDKVREASKLTDEEDVPEATITSFITKAQARIDAKLCLRFSTPFADPVPPLIESIAQDLAAGFLIEKYYSDRPDKTEPYLAEVLIKRAMADLDEILDGTMALEVSGATSDSNNNVVTEKPTIFSTTPRRSEMRKILDEWPL